MKVIQILLIGCLLLVTALGGCQGKTPAQYSTATPEGTVRLMYDAYCQLDAGKVAKFFVKEDRETARVHLEQLFDRYYSISIDNLQTKVLSRTEKEAEVEARYRITLTHFYIKKDGAVKIWEEGDERSKRFPGPPDSAASYDRVDKIPLVKQGGQWLIKTPK